MAIENMEIAIVIKRRWFFWPMFYACYAAGRIGVDPDRMALFLAKHCFYMKVA